MSDATDKANQLNAPAVAARNSALEQMQALLPHTHAQVALWTRSALAVPAGVLVWAMPSDAGPTLGASSAWVKTQTCGFAGDRAAVRHATHAHAVAHLLALLNHATPMLG